MIHDRISFLSVALLSGSLALAPAALGCGGSSAESQTSVAPTNATKAPIATTAHGPVKLFGEALGEVALRPEQRTEIEKLAADAEARHANARAAHQALAVAVAAQIEQGHIDRSTLQPNIDAVVNAAEQSRPADRAAFERLHAILDTDQRGAFIDAVEAKMHARFADKGHGPSRMNDWATTLKLTDAQREQVRDIFRNAKNEHHAQMQAEHGRGRAMFEAFRGDRFVLDEVAPPVDARGRVSERIDGMLGVAESILPILSPEQRSLAAGKLRAQATEMGEGF